jgi:hypothetical protein
MGRMSLNLKERQSAEDEHAGIQCHEAQADEA